MYPPEEKLKAVKLFLKYDRSCASVINELGYPDRSTLYLWVKDYEKHGESAFRKSRDRYTVEEKRLAVDHYFEHGRCLSRTRRALGYPGNNRRLSKWILELEPDRAKPKQANRTFTFEQRKAAVIDLESRKSTAQEIANKHGIKRELLYSWKRKLLGKEESRMPYEKPLSAEASELQNQIKRLEEQVKRLELEKDILEGTVEIIKKDPSADPRAMTNREKTILVGALETKYKLSDILDALKMPRSSYYYQIEAMNRPDKHALLRTRISEIFETSGRRYGYRRIWSVLKTEGTRVSEKVVCRLMKEENLIAKRGRRKKYSSYIGEIGEAPENLVKRNFHADSPNKLWLTDVTEFKIPAGKIYLSPVIDCFDGLVVAWTTSASPTAKMANTMLRAAIETLGDGEHPVIHSDRGRHYRWPEWVQICDEAELTRSMSKKGCSPDNSACEGFFGRMKVEMFYGENFAGWSIEEFMEAIDEYIHWYNNERIKETLGGMSPVRYRKSLGLLAA